MIGGFPVLATEWGAGRDLTAYPGEALTDPTPFLVVSAERTLAAVFPAPAPRSVLCFGTARHVGAYWNRTGTVEVDLVGGDERPVTKRIGPEDLIDA